MKEYSGILPHLLSGRHAHQLHESLCNNHLGHWSSQYPSSSNCERPRITRHRRREFIFLLLIILHYLKVSYSNVTINEHTSFLIVASPFHLRFLLVLYPFESLSRRLKCLGTVQLAHILLHLFYLL